MMTDRTDIARTSLSGKATLLALLAAGLLVMASPTPASATEPCPNEQLREEQHATYLPECRAYELVSPADKNGADVLMTDTRTRVSADGDAFAFAALAGFADVHGVEVASDYMSVRSSSANPGSSGWATHGVTPPQRTLAIADVLSVQEPLYTGPYSSDLTTGIFFGISPLTSDPMVSGVPNLYRRNDLRTPGLGTFSLVTGCPACDASQTPLPPSSSDDTNSQFRARPLLAGASPDFEHIAFESPLALTPDAPAQPALCNPAVFPFSLACAQRLYEWDHGVVRLAGILPDGTAADESFAGDGVTNRVPTPDVVSDGADGHTRVFFTQPTDANGVTLSGGASPFLLNSGTSSGNVFMRLDGSSTAQLNASERTTPDAFAPAQFLDASKDGTRAFFMTSQALTDDAPADGNQKIYLYDATKPDTDPHNLTLVDPDSEPADGAGSAIGAMGTSDDGHYFYFMQDNQLIRGGPLDSLAWTYLWHDGQLGLVGPAGGPSVDAENEVTGGDWNLRPRQSRVSDDGRTLLFSATSGDGLTGYDHGTCSTGIGFGCRELYVFDADTGRVACASCNPSGSPAVGMASVAFGIGQNTTGGTRLEPSSSSPLTADGSKVFFSSPDALVPEDTNGRYDAYEYDVRTGRLSLLTTGASTSDSYFVNADPSGRNVFVTTRQQLVGWDTDGNYDIYDVRVDGGFSDPAPASPPCSGDGCRGPAAPPPSFQPPSSTVFGGGGNLHPAPAASAPAPSAAAKRTRALKACRRKHDKTKRRRCEADARKRFAKTGRAK
jgi:hypothetical protein